MQFVKMQYCHYSNQNALVLLLQLLNLYTLFPHLLTLIDIMLPRNPPYKTANYLKVFLPSYNDNALEIIGGVNIVVVFAPKLILDTTFRQGTLTFDGKLVIAG